jgi:3-deoxy-D-manno-octulosonic acid kinase
MTQMLSGGDFWSIMDQANEGGPRPAETLENTETGAILYDRAVINHISDASFDHRGWQFARPVTGSLRSAGRGNTMIVGDGEAEFVLRHYRRGGLPGRLNRDLYLWLGNGRTRSLREWRLLATLTAMGLPVPRPAAARYRRVAGFFYTADLLTVRQPGIRALSDRLMDRAAGEDFWRAIGAGIHRFHQAGVCHADLNAYNVQVDANDRVVLLDFDRGRLLPPGAWQQRNLARLYRSLRKVRSLEPRIAFSATSWQQLMQGYSSAAMSA